MNGQGYSDPDADVVREHLSRFIKAGEVKYDKQQSGMH